LHSPETRRSAPLRPLLIKELREVAGGRALWIMLLLISPLVGYSFVQAAALYGESSAAGQQSPVLAASLSPLDGVLVPTFGALYVGVTLLFPFVAIRVLSHEKETGALFLLAQLPYPSSTLVFAKLVAVMAAWLLASVPALSALVVWIMLGGHLSAPETINLVLGHALYGLLVGSVALFAAAVCDSAATAAIVTLAFTIGSWVLDFTVAGRPGLFDWLARLSLTQALRSFEQGLLSAGVALGIAAAAVGFAALAGVWLRPGAQTRARLVRAAAWVLAAALAIGAAAQVRWSADASEDRRNSFPAADARLLATLAAPLTVTVHLIPEDPRFADLQRNVLAKLERAMPRVTVQLAAAAPGERDVRYGEVDYVYGGRSDMSRSTSHREVLPLLYSLAGVPAPAPDPGADYPGYPLVARGEAALAWFLGGLPLLIALAWLWCRRPPRVPLFVHQGGPSCIGTSPSGHS
jgi:ABC-2 type transport system permease protein